MIKDFLEEQGFTYYEDGEELFLELSSLDVETNKVIKDGIIVMINPELSIQGFLLLLMKECFKEGFYCGEETTVKSLTQFLKNPNKEKEIINPFESQLK